MALKIVSLEQCKTKLYQRENFFKYFNDITEEDLVEITKKVYRFLSIMYNPNTTTKPETINDLEKYKRILSYLSNPNIHNDLKTYDERIIFLIIAMDPNLITFKEFLKINILSIEEITKVESKRKRNQLFEERNKTLIEFESKIRSLIGVFDAKLLKYEEIFFKKFYNEKELITEVNQSNEDKFLFYGYHIKSFDSITEERFKELQEKAQTWLSLIPDEYKSKIATYSSTTQKNLIGLKTLAEQFAFYILIVDGNFDMLKIYEEESTMKKVEQRILEEFGFYNKTMIALEKKLHDRFYPDKQLSVWSKN